MQTSTGEAPKSPRRVAIGRKLLQISMDEGLHNEVRRTAMALDMPMAQYVRFFVHSSNHA